LNRQVRLSNGWRLRVHSGLASSASGSTIVERNYRLSVEEVAFGEMTAAHLSVVRDARERSSAGSEPDVSDGPLHGAELACRRALGAPFTCGLLPGEAPPAEMYGIAPQRTEMFPAGPVSVGDTWQIEGEDALRFLELQAGDFEVTFELVESESSYDEHLCLRVTYNIDGARPYRMRGAALTATISGSGEYFYCRPDGLVLLHTQDRTLNVSGHVARGASTTVVERIEDFRLEEETSLE
jgi:hypothetical protein